MLAERDVKTHSIDPASPWPNAFGERFNSSLRDECLDLEVFHSLSEARVLIEQWRRHYHTQRPHSSLGYPAPALLKALEDREEAARKERDSANKWRSDREYDLLPDLRAVGFADALRPAVLLSLNTGLRRGEVFDLRWDDVDLDRAMLTVRGKTANTRPCQAGDIPCRSLSFWGSGG
jgi:integrase